MRVCDCEREKRADLDWSEPATRQKEGTKSSTGIVGYCRAKRATFLEEFGSCQCSFPSSVYRVTFSCLPAQHPNKSPGWKQQPAVGVLDRVLEYLHHTVAQVCKISMERAQVGRRSTKTEQLFQILPPSVSRSTYTPSQRSTAATTAVVLHWYSCDAGL